MKVRDLLEYLQDEDPEREVILAKDAEGNEFSPLDEAMVTADANYVAESTWSGRVLDDEEYEQELEDSKDDDGLSDMPPRIPCIVLYPRN